MNKSAGQDDDTPDPEAYSKSYQWEVALKDLTTNITFKLSVVSDDYVEAGDIGVWAAASERNQPLTNYLVVGTERQRRITY